MPKAHKMTRETLSQKRVPLVQAKSTLAPRFPSLHSYAAVVEASWVCVETHESWKVVPWIKMPNTLPSLSVTIGVTVLVLDTSFEFAGVRKSHAENRARLTW